MPATSVLSDPHTHARACGLDPARLPQHAAVIMDGNGRWAKRRGWERFLGHRKGTESVRAVTTACVELGIPRLTLYAFSSENWHRPRREVDYLMDLLAEFLRGEIPTMLDNGVRLTAIGQLDRLPAQVVSALDAARSATRDGTATNLCLALSYGGRDELVAACRQLAQRAVRGEIAPESIDAEVLRGALYSPEDVDVVIRTAGERRMSNFLPWQAAYAEFIDHAALWPDFTRDDFLACLREYQGRERRFGCVTPS